VGEPVAIILIFILVLVVDVAEQPKMEIRVMVITPASTLVFKIKNLIK